jgi:hypothetical protein
MELLSSASASRNLRARAKSGSSHQKIARFVELQFQNATPCDDQDNVVRLILRCLEYLV